MSSSENHRGTSRYYKEDSPMSKRGRKYHPSSHHIPNHHSSSFNYQQYPNNPAPYPQSSQSNPFSSRRQEPSSSGISGAGQQLDSSSINHPSNEPHSSYSSESQYNRGWYGQTRRTNSYRSSRPMNFSTMSSVSNASVPGSIRSTHGIRDDLNNNPIASSPNSFKHSYINGTSDYSNGRYTNDYSRGEYFEPYRSGPPSSTGVEAPYLNGNAKRNPRDRFGPFTSSYSMRSGDVVGGPKSRGSDLMIKDPRYHNSQPNDYRGENYNRNSRLVPSHHREDFRSDELDYYRPLGSNQSSTDPQNSSPSTSRNQKYSSHSSKLSTDPKIYPSSDNVTHKTPVSTTPQPSDLNLAHSNNSKLLEIETDEVCELPKEELEIDSSNSADQINRELITDSSFNDDNKTENKSINDNENQEEKEKDFSVNIKEEKNYHNDRDLEKNPLKDNVKQFENTSVHNNEDQKQVLEEKELPNDENSLVTNDNINNDGLKVEALESNENEDLKVIKSTEHKNANEYSDVDFSDVEGCIFPMRKAEFRAWQLSHHSKSKRRQHLKYLNKDKIDFLNQYDFYDASLLIFRQADAYNLFNVFKSMYSILGKKKMVLTDEFVYRNKLWKTKTQYMDRQLENFYQSEKEQKEKANIEDQKPSNTRRGRHHGDSVRTEAEFMEILATLEQERERDPLIRAQYGAATIPDMTLDPIKKYATLRFMDSNNLVTDKDGWAKRIETDPIDSFTECEHEKFCEAFTLYPKRFGRISQFLGGLRSPEECVLHYYKTKKNRTNYKQLVANKNKKGKRKPLKKKKDITRGRTETSTPEYTTADSNASTPLNDSEVDKVSAEAIGHKRKNSFTFTNSKKQKYASEEDVVQGEDASDSTHLPNLNESNNTVLKLEPTVNVPDAQPKLEVTLDLKGVPNSKLSSPIQADHSIGVKQVDENHLLAMPSVPSDLPYDSPTLAESIINSKKTRKGRRKISTDEGERSHKDRTHISSYWSVQESSMFPTLLAEYGTDWEIIAKAIGTKTSAMVRNYYQRSLADNPDWKMILSTADIKRQPDINGEETDTKFVEPHPILNPSQPQNGPPLGFFYKKPIPSYTSASSSSIPITSSITSTQNAYHLSGTNPYYTSPPVFDANSHLTQPLDLSPITPGPLPQYNKQSSDNYQSTPSTAAIAPINRDVMNMNSLLNSSNDHPSQTSASSIPTKIHLPPLNLPSIPNPIPIPSLPKGKYSIMNLLNATDATQSVYYQSSTPTTHTSNTAQSSLFRPTISSIMNSTQPVSVYHTQPVTSPSIPSAEQTTSGMSALDALARVAFERK